VLASVFGVFGAVELMVRKVKNDLIPGTGSLSPLRLSSRAILERMAYGGYGSPVSILPLSTDSRMMTFLRLHILDEAPHPVFKPLLGAESLRRLAWSVWFLDATIDGGIFGFSATQDGSLTIQLPSDERPFLLHQNIQTEPLIPLQTAVSSSLGLGAHLIRSMQARQILADAHSRIQRRLVPAHAVSDLVIRAEQQAQALLDTLPREMHYNRVQYHAYKDQLPMLVHLHVMRNTCARHVALLQILVSSSQAQGDVRIQRQQLIGDAQAMSEILGDAMSHQVALDPQMAMHAYNAIEGECGETNQLTTAILFQPVRLSMERSETSISRPDAAKSLKVLLQVVRSLARVSELVNLIVSEIVVSSNGSIPKRSIE
jgi:hypothetical protein